MTGAEFATWIESVTCTKPFTVADAIELKAMIKALLGEKVLVDVYTGRGDQVFVRVDGRGWTLSVV